MQMSAPARAAIARELPKLAGADVASLTPLDPRERAAVRRAVDEGFVSAFRVVLIAAALLVLLGAAAGAVSPLTWVDARRKGMRDQLPPERDEPQSSRVERFLLDDSVRHTDSVNVRKAWTPPVRWVFGVATALGFFSWWQAYRLELLYPRPEAMPVRTVAKLLALNIAYWYVPALLIPAIATIARRFPLDSGNRLRAIVAHVSGALAFAVVRGAAMLGVRLALWGTAIKMSTVPWSLYVQRVFLEDLQWCFAVYGVIVGASHAVAYYHESQVEKLKEAQLETRLMEARLKTLQAELHPHFLFNTLHAISALIHRDPEDADRMISRLSDLLRITLGSERRGHHPPERRDRVPAEVSRHRTDAVPGSADRMCAGRSRGPRRRGAAHDSSAAGRERAQAWDRQPDRRWHRADRRRAGRAIGCGCRCAMTAMVSMAARPAR